MPKKKENYSYVKSLFIKVNNFLDSDEKNLSELPDIIVSFCIMIEKTVKITLYSKNPLLIFEHAHIRDCNTISVIALKKDHGDIPTIKMDMALDRFFIVFKNKLSQDKIEVLKGLYKIRNEFVHGYKQDNQVCLDSDDIIKKMGFLWLDISKICTKVLKLNQADIKKPILKYTQDELDKVLEDEVQLMISPRKEKSILNSLYEKSLSYDKLIPISSSASFGIYNRVCPRCKQRTLNHSGNSLSLLSEPGLYKCKECDLELTEKQYEIATRLNLEKPY